MRFLQPEAGGLFTVLELLVLHLGVDDLLIEIVLIVIDASTISLVDFWKEKYLPYIQAEKRPSTVNGYVKMWQRYLEDRTAHPIRDFRTVDCERLLHSIAHEHDICSTTLKHVKHLLGGVFRYAIRTGVLHGVNPVHEVCIPKSRQGTETKAYSLDQIVKMLEVLPQPSKAIIAIAAFAGLRKGELRALRPEDYVGASLSIRRAAWRKHVNTPKGKRGVGVVPLISVAGRLLTEYLASAQPKNYIFETMLGGPTDIERMVRLVIRPMLKATGLPWYGLHAFRRGLATNLHELGIADIVIQAILRHSDVGVTRRAYIKTDSADHRSLAAMSALEDAVKRELESQQNKSRLN